LAIANEHLAYSVIGMSTHTAPTHTGIAFEQPRLDIFEHAEASYRAMVGLDGSIELDTALRDLVSLRASIVNGCAYCVDMHSLDAQARNESAQRLHALAAWKEAPFFTERERAALALTDAITLVVGTHVPRDVFDTARAHFDDRELSQLIWAITVINAWNRIAISVRVLPGEYKPG
jgi:AhpD family alkylhydroperoxidase